MYLFEKPDKFRIGELYIVSYVMISAIIYEGNPEMAFAFYYN
ncbi:hypothetical protein [Spirosoma endophyticum]|uniref:Uncharacterized protein n=1 Tax=Spirosoma endophyticum TaxID=662367 RepID=A0A1I1UAB7_9BACT|nr:hypothetical protein [Spirosoma endophyticum]SFD67806.1 hypothetical protein SAMN05216167_106192 [Spirosoma endophyticum]